MWLTIIIIVLVVGLVTWAAMRKSRLGHWARVALMLSSGGFIFPNATVEDGDIAKHADKGAKVRK